MPEQPDLPAWARGAWRRTGLARGAGPEEPDGDVVWLQAGTGFADLRTGGSEERAFAGTTRWDGAALTWQHAVHWPPAAPLVDTGRVERTRDPDGVDVLVETGTWPGPDGIPQAYRERWRRVGDGPARAHHAAGAHLVVVGVHAVAVGPAGARRWERGATGWAVRATLGDPPGLAPS